MLNLHDLDMITSQYAYFTFEITPENCKGDDGRDEDACEAFEGLMDIANYIPATQEYQKFEDKVRQKMPEFAGLGYHMLPDDKVGGTLLYKSTSYKVTQLRLGSVFPILVHSFSFLGHNYYTGVFLPWKLRFPAF